VYELHYLLQVRMIIYLCTMGQGPFSVVNSNSDYKKCMTVYEYEGVLHCLQEITIGAYSRSI